MVKAEKNRIFIDGRETQIMSGAMHYFRTLPEQWRDRLSKLKAAGFNTVETYCCWNLHEPREGEYCFEGMLDVERFIETASEEGLYVIVRPGPYICSEWDLGGLPAWLLKNDGIQLRSCQPEYFDRAERYIRRLMSYITPHLQTRGGNVIMVAAENEYGSFSNSHEYMDKCFKLLLDCGVDVPIFTADGHTPLTLCGGTVNGAIPGLDFGFGNGVLAEHTEWVRKNYPETPIFHAEHWIGGTLRWGLNPPKYPKESVANEVRYQLENHIGFNLYMFHGGTNFGFMSGANAFTCDRENRMKVKYFSDCTSYDCDAPLNEYGDITPKYEALQEVMSQYSGKTLERPESVKTQNIGEVRLEKSVSLFDSLGDIADRFSDEFARNMEHYSQDYGYILYRTHIKPGQQLSILGLKDVFDRTHIYFNGIERGTIYRNDEKQYLENVDWLNEGGVLELLAENRGRVNFGPDMLRGERKGICGYVFVMDKVGVKQILSGWEIYTLPMNKLGNLKYNGSRRLPAFFTGEFKAKEKKDCFVHLDNFTKGFVTVNGFNLGRFWNIGPQLSLYLPWPLLKENNEITVFEEESCTEPAVYLRDYHILNDGSSFSKAKPTV